MSEDNLSATELGLPRFSLSRRITVLVLMATVAVVGIVAALRIPLELFPRGYTSSSLRVVVPWRDAPAEEMMDKVVLPLEEELATVRSLDQIFSYASTASASLNLVFRQGADMKLAYREVRDRIERARARLPQDAERVFIRKEDISGFPIAFVVISVDPSVLDPYDLVQNDVLLRLERIDGVASVRAHGLEQKEILIELDREATEGAGLNIYDLGNALAGDNFTLASGNVHAGDQKLLLRSVARYGSLEELQNRMVSPTVRLRDIATVRYAEPEKLFRARVNGEPSYFVEVLKEGEANTVAVSQAIRTEVEALNRSPRLANLSLKLVFDQGSVIRESLDTVVGSGKTGAWLAVAVLFFFLRRLRMTLIITLSIPLSLLVALAAMYFSGETLNILSLLGLMICVGMLVDNSIVVAENVYRLYREGVPRRQAAIRGAAEIALAITLATLTTVIVFLPVSLVEGEMQFFLLRLSIPISVSVLASLLVALVLVPLAVYLTLPERIEDEQARLARRSYRLTEDLFERLYEASLGRLGRFYESLLATFLKPGRLLDLGLVSIALFAAAIGLVAAKVVPFELQDREERNTFSIEMQLPGSSTMDDAEQYFTAVEAVMARIKPELGLEGTFVLHGATWGELQGWYPRGTKPKYTPRQLTEKVMAALPERAGVKLFTGEEEPGSKEKDATETLTLYGENAAELDRVARGLEDLLVTVPGVLAVKKSAELAPSELALVVDRDRAKRQGVEPLAIASVVGYALRGQSLPRFYTQGRDIPVRVRFVKEDRESLGQLADFDVPTASGDEVSLSSVTDVRFLAATDRLERRNKRLARAITLELAEGQEEAAKARLAAFAGRVDLPEGVRLASGAEDDGRKRELERDTAALRNAALLSIIFVYLLMAFLFESLILPVSILVTIPLAFIGVVGLHLVAGRPVDLLGGVGVVLLIGVVVNNGIVLIDCINRLREEGLERTAAILKATRDRYRPILMTALTTIFGTLPLIYGATSSTGLSYKSFGLTLTGGMTTATFLTLLLVPVVYAALDDAQRRLLGVVARFTSAKAAPAAPAG